jgi:hypothetical protein
MLQRKYGDEGNEQGDTRSALRTEVMRLKDQVKAEQAEAHTSREEMSRERKGRIVAEARVAELQRYIDADAEADRKREAQLAKLKAEAAAKAKASAVKVVVIPLARLPDQTASRSVWCALLRYYEWGVFGH